MKCRGLRLEERPMVSAAKRLRVLGECFEFLNSGTFKSKKKFVKKILHSRTPFTINAHLFGDNCALHTQTKTLFYASPKGVNCRHKEDRTNNGSVLP